MSLEGNVQHTICISTVTQTVESIMGKLYYSNLLNLCLVAICLRPLPMMRIFSNQVFNELATMFEYWGNHICSLYSDVLVNNKHIFLAINFSWSVGPSMFIDCFPPTGIWFCHFHHLIAEFNQGFRGSLKSLKKSYFALRIFKALKRS